MRAISGYDLGELLYQSSRSLVYRARRTADSRQVIVKLLDLPHPSTEVLSRFRHEYKVTRRLNVEGVVEAIEFISQGPTLGYVMEDIGGGTLAAHLAWARIELGPFLDLASTLADIVRRVHQERVIHKDINPSNIVFNPTSGELRLIDFGICSSLPSERTTVDNPEILEGSLPYIAPEQTGRMNRPIDYRSDFYSLGATYYEMLAGRPPFASNDPTELVHAHIAQQPEPPGTHRPDIPGPVGDIVLKLLSKTAEDRYQTAEGLIADLQECQRRLRQQGQIDPFPVGARDLSSDLRVPDRLYGRTEQVAELHEALERTRSGPTEVMLFRGPAGIGKSALVHEVHRGFGAEGGYFVSGKFDQLQNVPYRAFRDAIRDLVRQLLTESPEHIARSRQGILDAVGNNAGVVIRVIPEVAWLLGEQPAPAELGAVEEQARFNLAFQDFLRALTDQGRTLVLFADDLQWADSASLTLLASLIPDSERILLLGAYRDGEVSAGHPLLVTLNAIADAGTPIHEMNVEPLDADEVGELLSDTLDRADGDTMQLAELLHAKTAGNPYFLRQLLASLHDRLLITLDPGQARWTWDIDQIRAVDITENVVDLMSEKIQGLPPATRRALEWAACLGSRFDLETLAAIDGREQKEVASELWAAVTEGLIAPVGDAYRLISDLPGGGEGKGPKPASLRVIYRFAHDRVQQAAYSLVPESRLAAVHLELARALRNRAGLESAGFTDALSELSDQATYDLANHYNLGRTLVDEDERRELATLNLQAGKRAKSAAAYQQSLDYFAAGLASLGESPWTDSYDACLELYLEAAEAAYLSTEFDRSDRLVGTVLERAKRPVERARAYESRIQSLMARQRLQEAVTAAREALVELGISLPAAPTTLHVLLGYLRARLTLRGRSVDDLRSLPDMTDPQRLAAMRILMIATAPIYFTVPRLFPLVAFEMVKLSVRHGNAAYSAYGYGIYGILLCAAFGDIPRGYRFGRLGLDLVERFDARHLIAKVTVVFNSSVAQWKDPLHTTLEPLLDAFQAGVEAGDAEYASLCVGTYGYNSYVCGVDLPTVALRHDRAREIAKRFKQAKHDLQISLFRQAIEHFIKEVDDPSRLEGEYFDERERMVGMTDSTDVSLVCQSWILKSTLALYYGDWERSVSCARQAGELIDSLVGTALQPVYHFIDALAVLRMHGDIPMSAPSRRRVRRALKRLSHWAEHAPSNFRHKVLLIEAERARVSRDWPAAMGFYDQAIGAAREANYLNEEALAALLAGLFYQSIDRPGMANQYLLDARDACVRWGAEALVRRLDREHPNLVETVAREITAETTAGTTPTGSTGQLIDVAAVTRASRAISSELVLERLLDRLMRIVVENAGAQNGVLVLAEEGQLVIEASLDIRSGEVSVLESEPVASSNRVSPAIINYVVGTREPLVLADAGTDIAFSRDPYVAQNEPRSVLCLPLLNQGELTGVLYLENNLTTGAFTEARLEVLRILSGEIAISIENARLYANLERKVEERTEQLQKANQELATALESLQAAQTQLVHTEKMASLGQLTAGIAHEIKNPLNFVNNFARSIGSLADELTQELAGQGEKRDAETRDAVDDILTDLRAAAERVVAHGERADSIIRSMMLHARDAGSEQQPTDLNKLVGEYVELTYHGMAAQQPGFSVHAETSLDPEVGEVSVVPQDLGRVLANLLSNAYYAVVEQRGSEPAPEPRVAVHTRRDGDSVEIVVEDNGPGVPAEIRDAIFEPFYTTKPAGSGTGLGLSLSYDIIVSQHGGDLRLEDPPGGGARFVIRLPG